MLQQIIPARGRVANAEFGSDCSAEAALFQIFYGLWLLAQLLTKKMRSAFQQFVQSGGGRGMRFLVAAERHGQTGLFGEFLHGFDKIEVFVGHYKADVGAGCASAETVVLLLGGAYGKRRRFFIM